MSIGVLLAFDCFLRVGELTSLKRIDVADVGDPRIGSLSPGMALRLGKTKTGTDQWVTVHRNCVMVLMRLLLSTTNDNDFLFPFTPSALRDSIHSVCEKMNLSSRYVPHSLRHGGATDAFESGMSVEDVQLRGRWASTKSARRYIQSGPAKLLSLQVPPLVAKAADRLAVDVVRAFAKAATIPL